MVEKQLFLCNEIFKKWLKKAFFWNQIPQIVLLCNAFACEKCEKIHVCQNIEWIFGCFYENNIHFVI